jgi:hypothetical protein
MALLKTSQRDKRHFFVFLSEQLWLAWQSCFMLSAALVRGTDND